MNPIKIPPSIRIAIGFVIYLGLSACGREVYTTWSCHSSSESKISMVLRKAQMEFKGVALDYCGSLGAQSYFDEKCSGQTDQSKVFSMNRLSPKKLLLTKWTAVKPIAKQKHFLVSKVILPEPPNEKIEFVEIEAVYSKKTSQIAWRDLTNSELWLQGWK